jgi:hypothetical protein
MSIKSYLNKKDPHDAAIVNTEIFLAHSTEDKHDLLTAYHTSKILQNFIRLTYGGLDEHNYLVGVFIC